MKKAFREASHMRSPAGNKSPTLAQDAQKPRPAFQKQPAKGKSHHTRTQNPGIRASGRVHCLAHLVRILCRTPTSYTQSTAFRRRGAPLSRARTPKATRRDEAAGLAEATKTPIVQLRALANTGTGTCRGWAVPCMPGQCSASTRAGWQAQHPSPSMNAVSCSRMCCAAFNPCPRDS
jgi:hypothetical protein